MYPFAKSGEDYDDSRHVDEENDENSTSVSEILSS